MSMGMGMGMGMSMGMGMNMNSKQTVSREEYRRLDNRVTCILQQRWPAKEISRWAGLLKGNQPPMWRKKCAASWIDVNVKAPPMAAPP